MKIGLTKSSAGIARIYVIRDRVTRRWIQTTG